VTKDLAGAVQLECPQAGSWHLTMLTGEAEGRAMDAAELFKRYGAGERAFADINLCCANLQRAKLRGAYLHGASLRWANLRGADLRWANLTRASLAGANLTGANLKWAYLVEADLRAAIVADEQLAQAASLKGAILPDGRVHE
jgi:uncharacterized protein YjbI with pentapeptide repeats